MIVKNNNDNNPSPTPPFARERRSSIQISRHWPSRSQGLRDEIQPTLPLLNAVPRLLTFKIFLTALLLIDYLRIILMIGFAFLVKGLWFYLGGLAGCGCEGSYYRGFGYPGRERRDRAAVEAVDNELKYCKRVNYFDSLGDFCVLWITVVNLFL